MWLTLPLVRVSKTVQQPKELPMDSGIPPQASSPSHCDSPLQCNSIVELLSVRAQFFGDRPLYSFLSFEQTDRSALNGGPNGDCVLEPAAVYTYADLDARSRSIASWLQNCELAASNPIQGQRVLLVFPPGLDYLSAYFGCLYAGAIAVPAYPPRRNRRADRLRAIVRDAGLTMVLAPHALIDSLRDTIAEDEVLSKLHWQAIESISLSSAENWVDPRVDRNSIAFLQYTSGSTGDPKGVVVTHGNLLHNQHLIRQHFATQRNPSDHSPAPLTWDQKAEDSETVVGWLPLHHDMGLIGNVLHPLYVGGQLIFMAPIDFLQKPIRWLQAISRFRATISGGPNFAYRLCTDELDLAQCTGLDLSSWKVAFNGAEPIDATVLQRFATKFQSLGFSTSRFCPCYGMAETTLLVTSSTCGDEIVTDAGHESSVGCEQVGCGQIVPSEMDVRIVDPETNRELPVGEEGEIWVSGDSVAAGYWNRPEQTKETFAAALENCATTTFLRTGDLGYTRNGQLFITSRLKDLIIVRGVNYYPQDIERTVEQADSSLQVGGAAAFSINVDGEERVAVVQEVRRTSLRGLDVDSVCSAVRRAVSDAHDLSIASVLLIRPGGLPKTTSGKVQRGQARALFLTDELNPVGRWDIGRWPVEGSDDRTETAEPDPTVSSQAIKPIANEQPFTAVASREVEQLSQWLRGKIASRLKLASTQLDVHQPLANYGLDSVSAVRLAGEVSDHLGRNVPATLAYEYPTISLIAEYLCGNSPAESGEENPSQKAVSSEPLAVVGIGCRFPGANSTAEFWEMLAAGRDAIGQRPDPHDGREFNVGSDVPVRAGYIDNVDRFDASFFGINPREADALDPQQRLMLETTWQAFEDAGIAIDQLAGKSVGVFVGAGNNDYSRLNANDGNAYGATGNSLAMTANRLSYTFNFRGPSLTIDTACSSSLVATHQAIASLRRGECSMAVVGGVNLILSGDTTTSLSEAGMLSPTGTCRAMSEGADGFVRGEGCGVVVLKPLSAAVGEGNRIYAVLRGSAVNQDGRTNGLTAPSRIAQQQLIEAALRNSQVSPAEIDYIEAHGTGTELGDPIEMRAIRAAIIDAECSKANASNDRDRDLIVGAVKTNIGHLEAAAGIAGLIKVCLSLAHGKIPATLNFTAPNPHIDFTNVAVPTATVPWTNHSVRARIAGVSSFGFGGANAHVVVQQAPVTDETSNEKKSQEGATASEQLCVFSARTEETLAELIGGAKAIDQHLDIADVAYTLAAGRVHHGFRAAVLCSSTADLREQSTEFDRRVIRGKTTTRQTTTWMFSGQGGTFAGVGRQLHDSHITFRRYFDQANDACQQLAGFELPAILWGEDDKWLDIQIQPAIYCLQWTLARTYAAMGILPDVVLGHSLGEYAAACVAGVFSFEDGLRIVTKRAELTGRLTERGGMLAIFADEPTVARWLENLQAPCDIAAINGQRQTVVAGRTEDLAKLAERLNEEHVTTRLMQTSHGFHSRLIEPVLDEFEQFVATISMSAPNCEFVSTQSGTWLTESERRQVATPTYWRGNLRSSVRFLDSLLALSIGLKQRSDNDAPTSTLALEMGAGSTLSSIVRSAKLGIKVLPGLICGDQERAKFLENVAYTYVQGLDLDWQAALGFQRTAVSLPTYPFARERFWYGLHSTSRTNLKPSANASTSSATNLVAGNEPPSTSTYHPLLGQELDVATDAMVYDSQLLADKLWSDHVVGTSVVFPAAGLLEWAHAAGQKIELLNQSAVVSDFQIEQPLLLDETQPTRCQLVLFQQNDAWRAKLVSRTPQGWQQHATWTYVAIDNLQQTEPRAESFGLDVPPQNHASWEAVNVDSFYDRFAAAGLNYGPSFRGLKILERSGQSVRATCQLPAFSPTSDRLSFAFHPALLDSCLQSIAAADGQWGRRTWLPIGCERYVLRQASLLDSGLIHVVSQVRTPENAGAAEQADTRLADLQITSSDGRLLAQVQGLKLRATTQIDVSQWVFQQSWPAQIRPREPQHSGAVSAQVQFEKTRQLAADCANDGGLGIANVLDALESVSTQCVVAIFQQLGLTFSLGARFSTADLAQRLGIVSQHQRLFNRMVSMLHEAGYLAFVEGQWSVVKPADNIDVAAVFETALSEHPDGKNEFELLHRCVANAAQCLTHGLDPLPLLFPSDGQISAAEVYRDSAGGRMMNRMVATAVGELVDSLAPGRGLRILEIGAGTGATTDSVLPMLPGGRVHYRFTDIASSFLTAARNRFSAFEFVDYQILDIEQPPASSLLGQFDLIVAANVLHATTDLTASIVNAKSLLAENGRMLVVEGMRPVKWMDLTFGLTSGWWRFEDTDLRPDYPLLTSDRWLKLLENQGFQEAEVIEPTLDAAGIRTPENALVVARNQIARQEKTQSETIDAETTESNRLDRHLLLIGKQNSNFRRAIVSEFKLRHQRTSLVSWDFSAASDNSIEAVSAAELSSKILTLQPTDIVILGDDATYTGDAANGDLGDVVYQRSCRLLELLQALIGCDKGQGHSPFDMPQICLVTSNCQPATAEQKVNVAEGWMLGMWRTLVLEQPTWKCRSIDVDGGESAELRASAVADELLAAFDESESEIAFRNKHRLVRRLTNFTADQMPASESNRVLRIDRRGSLDGLTLVPQQRRRPACGEVEIAIRAAGLNFRDVLNTLDLYPSQPPLGAEAIGVVCRVGDGVRKFAIGQRVAVLAAETFAQFITVPEHSVVAIPDGIDDQQAATVPVAYLTAAMSLLDLGKLASGEHVLIHSAAGGVGRAAIAIAKHVGTTIYATASTSKHQQLRDLGIEHVFDSRSLGFADEILAATEGRGVDLVLNSLDTKRVSENIQSLAKGGRYVDITIPDEAIRCQVETSEKQLAYHSLDLSAQISAQPQALSDRLGAIYAHVLADHNQPLPFDSFPLNDFEAAFRIMRDGKSNGKLLLCSSASSSELLDTECPNAEGWQWVVGGLGGLGTLVLQDLASRGHRQLAVVSRSTPTQGQAQAIDQLRAQGVELRVFQGDVADIESVSKMAAELRETGSPISGVYHLAGNLDDATLIRQTPQSLAKVLGAKVRGAWNLHQVTFADPIERFVLFSSASAIFGSPGQANHATANAFLDTLSQYRKSLRLPSLSINWGPWSHVGAAASRSVDQRSDLAGIEMLEPSEGMAIYRMLNAVGSETPAAVAALRLNLDRMPEHVKSGSLFEQLAAATSDPKSDSIHATNLTTQLDQVEASQHQSIMIDYLRTTIAATLGMRDPNTVFIDKPLFEMGIDSLTSLELVNSLKSALGFPVSTNELFNYPTITQLSKRLLELHRSRENPTLTSSPSTITAADETTTCDLEEQDSTTQDLEISDTNTHGELATLLAEIGSLSDEFDQWEATR